MFDRSGRWGRDRIAEVRTEAAQTLDHLTDPDVGTPETSQPEGAGDHGGSQMAAGQPPHPGRAVAWAAFASGIAASVAANVLHAQHQSASPAAWVGAAFWPIALLLAIEVLTRNQWTGGSRWYAVARYGGTGLVAVVAAVISYRHMAALLTAWGEDPVNAHSGRWPSTGSWWSQPPLSWRSADDRGEALRRYRWRCPDVNLPGR